MALRAYNSQELLDLTYPYCADNEGICFRGRNAHRAESVYMTGSRQIFSLHWTSNRSLLENGQVDIRIG